MVKKPSSDAYNVAVDVAVDSNILPPVFSSAVVNWAIIPSLPLILNDDVDSITAVSTLMAN
jgi:hypothetical protein